MAVPASAPESVAPTALAVESDPDLPRPATLEDVPGWFPPTDHRFFCWLLEYQRERAIQGDLLEVGVYLGRSAILLGSHLREGETFTVCDLFESEAPDSANSAEMDYSYRETLTRRAFEANYLSFHDALPRIHQGPSQELAETELIAPDSQRFIHIDASHLYQHVAADLAFARKALREDGILVMDDYRSEHTPGVAAATWEAVLTQGLRPVALTPQKFYATWGDPEPVRQALIEHCRERSPRLPELQVLYGEPIPRLWASALLPQEQLRSRWFEQQQAEQEAREQAERAARRRIQARARRLAIDLTPPLAARALRRLRARARDRAQAQQDSRP
ncbi:class I SAM-dependent methyltransferase [Streptacidiphilus pinicola]|uniref:Class I SAM-dependent methyltransferase n=1 Tax=Streptacidiphilus pinicola TaxID=2219663 RepID=A0A2X0K6H0_9ACTN|nr:class I SAM-dependent methyltransferase [Streptacidiphilus pinicola]RAG82860.1 class I SAM-dependent methyltransferase [Streptacidiphilus pinicola]